MPAHYETLKAQLKTDLYDVLGNSAVICFGRPRRPIEEYPSAVIVTRVIRTKAGPRTVHETYEFTIAVRLPIPAAYPDDGGEAYVMEQAEYLSDKLAPHTHESPPPSDPTAYAGVGMMPEVTEVESLDSEDADPWLGYMLKFRTVCRVNQ